MRDFGLLFGRSALRTSMDFELEEVDSGDKLYP
ncbi:hypothetical protein NIES3974_06930 [Calothrix sp. NIES-3974]|nr:hypothetical protein NIES3974_06930 [Calothrix sp. NIES-3974]